MTRASSTTKKKAPLKINYAINDFQQEYHQLPIRLIFRVLVRTLLFDKINHCLIIPIVEVNQEIINFKNKMIKCLRLKFYNYLISYWFHLKHVTSNLFRKNIRYSISM